MRLGASIVAAMLAVLIAPAAVGAGGSAAPNGGPLNRTIASNTLEVLAP